MPRITTCSQVVVPVFYSWLVNDDPDRDGMRSVTVQLAYPDVFRRESPLQKHQSLKCPRSTSSLNEHQNLCRELKTSNIIRRAIHWTRTKVSVGPLSAPSVCCSDDLVKSKALQLPSRLRGKTSARLHPSRADCRFKICSKEVICCRTSLPPPRFLDCRFAPSGHPGWCSTRRR